MKWWQWSLMAAVLVGLTVAIVAVSANQPKAQTGTPPKVVRTYTDTKAVLAGLPAEHRPPKGGEWSSYPLLHKAAEKWYDNLNGDQFVGTVAFSEAGTPREASITVFFDAPSIPEMGFGGVSVAATFPAAALSSLSKVRSGELVKVSGTISGVTLRPAEYQSERGVYALIHLTDCTVAPGNTGR